MHSQAHLAGGAPLAAADDADRLQLDGAIKPGEWCNGTVCPLGPADRAVYARGARWHQGVSIGQLPMPPNSWARSSPQAHSAERAGLCHCRRLNTALPKHGPTAHSTWPLLISALHSRHCQQQLVVVGVAPQRLRHRLRPLLPRPEHVAARPLHVLVQAAHLWEGRCVACTSGCGRPEAALQCALRCTRAWCRAAPACLSAATQAGALSLDQG